MNFKLSPATINALIRGLIAGFISLTIYLLIVIFTTPNLPPLASLNAAMKVNWIIIVGLSVGVGSQIYVSSYGKNLGCSIANKKKGILGSSASTAISSFLLIFLSVPIRMLWKLACHSFIPTIRIWKRILSSPDTILQTTLIFGIANCVRLLCLRYY